MKSDLCRAIWRLAMATGRLVSLLIAAYLAHKSQWPEATFYLVMAMATQVD